MTLRKRYLRNIKHSLSFYLSSLFLTMLALLAFFMMNIAGNGILDFADDFFEAHHLEDANFKTYMQIPPEDIPEIEEKFDAELNAQRLVNLTEDGKTVRIFCRTESVNTYEITVGEDFRADDEVIISEGYADYNNIKIGDSLTLAGTDYRIVGFFQRPDYLFMTEDPDDDAKNVETFFLCYLTDRAFDKLENTSEQYYVRFNQDNHIEFRKYINDNYHMSRYTAAENNMRIQMVVKQAKLFIIMSYMVLVLLPLVVVMLISIIIGRKVKSEQRMIGTLSALGYTKAQMIRHYAGFAAVPGIFGGVLAVIVAAVCAQPFGEVPLNDYEPLRVHCHLPVLAAVLGVIVPTLMYVLSSARKVRRLMKADTVELLNGTADSKENRIRHILVDSKMSFRKKFALRSILGNPSRTFVVFLGIFLGCFIMLFGYSFFDSLEHVGSDSAKVIGDFEYEYVFNVLKTGDFADGEAAIVATAETEDGKTFQLIGVDSGNRYLHFKDENGKETDVSTGNYLTSVEAYILNIGAGDRLKVYNPMTMECCEITIDGVIENNYQKAVFMSRAAAADMLGLDADMYNAVMTTQEQDYPDSELYTTIRKADTAEEMDKLIDTMKFLVYFLLFVGAAVCLISVYVTVNTLVTESRGNISMLKVLGYKDSKIDAIVLNIHHILLPVGILLSIPAAYGCCALFYRSIADLEGALVTPYIAPKSFLIAAALTVVSYFGSLLLIRRKVHRVDMVESLKDNRE